MCGTVVLYGTVVWHVPIVLYGTIVLCEIVSAQRLYALVEHFIEHGLELGRDWLGGPVKDEHVQERNIQDRAYHTPLSNSLLYFHLWPSCALPCRL